MMDAIIGHCYHKLVEHSSTIIVSTAVFCVLSIINAAMTIGDKRREVRVILNFYLIFTYLTTSNSEII